MVDPHGAGLPVDAVQEAGRARVPALLGRKSLVVGALTSVGLVVADATGASAAEVADLVGYVPRWAPYMQYAGGRQVVSPNNDVVSAKVAHRSSATYATDTAKWSLSSTYLTPAGADTKIATQHASDNSTYLAGATSTKTDGHNVKNLRRPTLVVDKMFPNGSHDHQVVWVDETLKMSYAIGQDHRLRRNTWTAAGQEAEIFGNMVSSPPAASSWAQNGVFMRVPVTGTLLMEQRDTLSSANTILLRSTNNGGSGWTTVWTAPVNTYLLGPQSICRDAITGYIYVMEYTTNVAVTVVNIWRSTDDGATFTVFNATPRSETDQTKIRHWHSMRFDAISGRVYFMAGDTSPVAGLYRVNAGGTDIEPVLLNGQITSPQPAARAVDLMFFPTHIAWAVDGEDPHVRRMNRDQLELATPVTERVATTNSTGWYAQQASVDGSVWVFGTSTEPIAGATDLGAHMYACTENGASVDEIGAIMMDGNAVGFASLSGMGGSNGGGDSFWLRAHNYQGMPYQTNSAFQMRAKVVWGTSPIIKPPALKLEYARESRNWLAAMTAGQTLAFSHNRAPDRTRKMNILGVGIKTMPGGGTGVFKLQIYNITTSTIMMEFTGSQNWRFDSFSDTTQLNQSLLFASGDQVEFRLIETGGVNPGTVSVFVEFGWAFP